MSRLFIELYLDEDVDVLVAEMLRARGFAATTTRDAGRRQRSDADQLVYAVRQRKALLTHNRTHFEQLAREYFESGKIHYGIILAVRRPPQEIVRRLLVILDRVAAEEMQNQIRYI